jgi:hypothetical protein
VYKSRARRGTEISQAAQYNPNNYTDPTVHAPSFPTESYGGSIVSERSTGQRYMSDSDWDELTKEQRRQLRDEGVKPVSDYKYGRLRDNPKNTERTGDKHRRDR